MKPVLVYVDDEPHNLTVLEAVVPPDWEVHVFDSPLKALEKINQMNPWVVLSDQRMPGMSGVGFLELVRKISPYSIRAIVTGFSEEDLVVESVRKAHIFDYIRKPWDVDDLIHRVSIMVDTFKLEMELRNTNVELVIRNKELEATNKELSEAKDRETKLRRELEAWAPPFTLSNLQSAGTLQFPKTVDLAVMAYDIVQSSKLHGVNVNGKPIRGLVLQGYTQCVIKHGGWRESSSGDSAYAHFGMLKNLERPADAALAAATEFRLFLRNLSQTSGIEFESGIAIHLAPDCLVDIHELKVQAFDQEIIHKSFMSASMDIDLVHRMEKLMHQLPGSNITMSKAFVEKLSKEPPGLINIGAHLFKGQNTPVELFVKLSDRVGEDDLKKVMASAADTDAESSSLAKVA
ncbi:MAG: response regulator [Pseudobdellovibrionaceae bacterium]